MKSIKYIMSAIFIILSAAAYCSEDIKFKDVPDNHWAKESVEAVSEKGIMVGYLDNTFKGNNYLTRYEFVVALDRMVEFILNSQKPLELESKQENNISNSSHWAKQSIAKMTQDKFIARDFIFQNNGNEFVTQEEVGTLLADAAVRIVETIIPSAFESK